MKYLLTVAMLALAAPSHSQTLSTVSGTAVDAPAPVVSDSVTQLYSWAKAQRKSIGVSYDLHHVKYVATSWDLVSIGDAGLNVAKASAKDYIDFGPTTAVANAAPTRYGQAVPIHFGNIWNQIATHQPRLIAAHASIASLPDVTLVPMFLFPRNGAVKTWTWRDDFQLAVLYSFGGAAVTP